MELIGEISATPSPDSQKLSWADRCADRSSEEPNTPRKVHHSVVAFILNRNNKSEEELSDIFNAIIKRDFPESDAYVTWVSVLGKTPERPHAFVIFSDSDIMKKLIDQDTLAFDYEGKKLSFEISRVIPGEPIENHDPCKLYFTNIPTNMAEAELKETFTEFIEPIADVKEVILPGNWKRQRHLFVEFYDQTSTAIVMRIAKISQFHNTTIYASYARKQDEARKHEHRESGKHEHRERDQKNGEHNGKSGKHQKNGEHKHEDRPSKTAKISKSPKPKSSPHNLDEPRNLVKKTYAETVSKPVIKPKAMHISNPYIAISLP
jgi:hypothetical protein